MAITYLDSSGKSREVKLSSWNDGLAHWGRYGAWVMFNLDHSDLTTVVTDASVDAGDGMFKTWHIKWS